MIPDAIINAVLSKFAKKFSEAGINKVSLNFGIIDKTPSLESYTLTHIKDGKKILVKADDLEKYLNHIKQ